MRIKDDLGYTVGAMVVALVAFLALLTGALVVAYRHDSRACAAKGGTMVTTDETYTTTTYVNNMPIVSTHHVVECHVPG